MSSVIGYGNITDLAAATITLVGDNPDNPAANAFDGLANGTYYAPQSTGTSDVFLDAGESFSASYFAIYDHNLGANGATITLSWGVSATGSWTDLATLSPDKSEASMATFTAVSARYWRVRTVLPSLVYIGVIAFGESIVMRGSVRPSFKPVLVDDWESNNTISESGNMLGRHLIRRPAKISASFTVLDDAWIRSTWQPFIERRVIERPWFWRWNSQRFPKEIAFCQSEDIPHPTYDVPFFMSINLTATGYRS